MRPFSSGSISYSFESENLILRGSWFENRLIKELRFIGTFWLKDFYDKKIPIP